MGKLVIIGCGGVGSSVLELMPLTGLLPKKFYEKILIIEPKNLPKLGFLKQYNITHKKITLTPKNLDNIMDSVLNKGDFIIDSSVDVDGIAIIGACQRNKCMYINSSMECWSSDDSNIAGMSAKKLYEMSLYSRVLICKEKFGKKGRPTAVFDIGANPGSVSWFTLQGIEDFAKAEKNTKAIKYVKEGKMAEASRELDIRVIHITEYDSQLTFKPKKKGVFENTWSSVGLAQESIFDPIQIGFSPQDTSKLPKGTIIPPKGPKIFV